MTNKPFDPTKPVQTRDGRKARIICTDIKHPNWPIAACVEMHYGGEEIRRYTREGILWAPGEIHSEDLINIPARIHREVWVNVFDGVTTICNTRAFADFAATWNKRIACIPITIDCEEGEGLDERA